VKVHKEGFVVQVFDHRDGLDAKQREKKTIR